MSPPSDLLRPAETLAAAIDAFEFFELRPGTPPWGYYVEERLTYRTDRMADLVMLERDFDHEARRTRGERQYPKYMLSGHKGAGKSTELARLADRFGDRFEVISCRLYDRTLNEADLNARDVLFAIAASLVARLEAHRALARLERDPEAIAALRMLKTHLPKGHIEDAHISFNRLGLFSARFRFDTRLRGDLREIAERQPEPVLKLIERPAAALEALVGRPVLLIVDDLDKAGPQVVGRDRLFGADLGLLLSLPMATILTIPVDIHHDAKIAGVARHEKKCVVDHVKLWATPEATQRFEPGWDVMRSFVHKRAASHLFEESALDEVIRLAGGSMELLRRLLRDAVDIADYQRRSRVELPHVREARRRPLADFVRQFGADRHILALHRIHEQKRIQTPDDLVYLPTLAVMEHLNDDPWHDTNPILTPFVEAQWDEMGGRERR